MKKVGFRTGAVALLAAIATGFVSHAAAQYPQLKPGEAGRDSAARLLVQPRAGVTLEQFDEILKRHGAHRVGVIPQINTHIVDLPSEADPRAAALLLKRDRRIESVEVDERVAPSLAPECY